MRASLDSTYVVSGHTYLQSAIAYVVDANERCSMLGWLTRTNMCGVCASSVTDDKGLVDTSHNGQLFSNNSAACSYLHQNNDTMLPKHWRKVTETLKKSSPFWLVSTSPLSSLTYLAIATQAFSSNATTASCVTV